MMHERNGFEAITMERRNFLRIVHEQLPDRSHVVTGKRVVDVVDNEDGVSVKLDDGTTEEGDILIGCDGVHSTVRELMWRNANVSVPNYINTDEKRSLVTTYNSLVCVANTIPGLGIRDMHWVCHPCLSFLILTQPDQTYFFVNWKMPQKMQWPSKAKWTKDEADRAVASVTELPISDSVVFGELWKHKIRAHLIGLEEGIFKHWHFGRLALVGDSVHKVTPNFALGANCALDSSAALLNEVVSIVKSGPEGTRPSRSAISAMFERYQESRKPRMQRAFDVTHFLTRIQSCDGPLNHFIMRVIFPLTGQAVYADQLADLCAGAPKFNFLPMEYPNPSTVPWKNEIMDQNEGSERMQLLNKLGGKPPRYVTMELVSLLFILVLFFTAFAPGRDLTVSGSTYLLGNESIH